MRGAGFRDVLMFEGGGEGGHGLRPGFFEQGFKARIKEVRREMKPFGVARDQILIGFHDADELHIGAASQSRQKTQRVVVIEADHRQAYGRFGFLRRPVAAQQQESPKKEAKCFH